MEQEKKEYDYINPSHYKENIYGKETIDIMIDVFGEEDVYKFCLINSFKYRMRMGTKPNEPAERDIKKSLWYENKAMELKQKICQKNT